MAGEIKKFILVNIGKQPWALPLADGSDFFELKDIVPIPDVDRQVMGLTYHQGHIVVILDTNQILNQTLSDKDQQCVRVDWAGDHYGLLINKAGRVVETKQLLIDKNKKFFPKYILADNKKVSVLDIQDLLSQLTDYGQS